MKTFICRNGLKLSEGDLLVLVAKAVEPPDEHYLTFLKTFQAVIDLLEQRQPGNPDA